MIEFIGGLLIAGYIILIICFLASVLAVGFRKWNKGKQYKEDLNYEVLYPWIIVSFFNLWFTFSKINELFYPTLTLWCLFYLIILLIIWKRSRTNKLYSKKKIKDENFKASHAELRNECSEINNNSVNQKEYQLTNVSHLVKEDTILDEGVDFNRLEYKTEYTNEDAIALTSFVKDIASHIMLFTGQDVTLTMAFDQFFRTTDRKQEAITTIPHFINGWKMNGFQIEEGEILKLLDSYKNKQ